MTTKTFCNKCGIIKKEEQDWLVIQTNKGIMDLCENCSNSFKKEYDL